MIFCEKSREGSGEDQKKRDNSPYYMDGKKYKIGVSKNLDLCYNSFDKNRKNILQNLYK